jgi:hypothetical protein
MHLHDRREGIGKLEEIAGPHKGIVDTQTEDGDGSEVPPGEGSHLDHQFQVHNLKID